MAIHLDRITQARIDGVVARLAVEYDGIFPAGTVTRLVEDSVERLGDILIVQFVPVLVERFARERLLAAAQTAGRLPKERPQVLFVCTENAGRSQMAEALARHVSEGRVDARSAGSNPAGAIELAAVEVMAEIGVSMAFGYPKPLTEEVIRSADVVVTMGCHDACPIHPGPQYLDWPIADPAGAELADVRLIRQDIANHVLDLLKDLLT